MRSSYRSILSGGQKLVRSDSYQDDPTSRLASDIQQRMGLVSPALKEEEPDEKFISFDTEWWSKACQIGFLSRRSDFSSRLRHSAADGSSFPSSEGRRTR